MSNRPTALLINPPVYDFACYDLFFKPLGLLRLADWLKKSDWEIKVINCLDYKNPLSTKTLGLPKRKKNGCGKFFRQTIEKPDAIKNIKRSYARYGILESEIRRQIQNSKADAVFITSLMTYWYPGLQEIINLIKIEMPKTPIFCGGIYASLLPEHCRSLGADYIIQGADLNQLIPIFHKKNWPAQQNQAKIYVDAAVFDQAGILQLNRGCPFSCSYCASRLLGAFESGDAQQAFQLFLHYFDNLGIRHFAFYDDALLVNKEKILWPFLEAVLACGRKANFYLPNALHIKFMDFKTASLMRKCDFQEIRLGWESAEKGFHQKLDQKFLESECKEAVLALKEAGFNKNEITAYVLAGLPDQEADSVEQSLYTASKLGLTVKLARYSPVPGTRLWEESCQKSHYPLAEEPLYQNNSFFALEWKKFTHFDNQKLSNLCIKLNQGIQ